MDCIKWGSEYDLGIATIDAQHVKLIGIINAICNAIGQTTPSFLAERIQELEQYAQEHFALEEGYFKEFQYDGAKEHLAQHQTFKAKIEELKTALAQGANIEQEMMVYLANWFANHVLQVDHQYKECFLAHGLH